MSMSRIRPTVKGILFLSSYTPLFFIFLLKNISDRKEALCLSLSDPINTIISKFFPLNLNSAISFALIAILLGSNLLLFYLLMTKRHGNNPKGIRIVESKEANYAYVEYLLTYVIPFLPLTDSSSLSLLYGFVFLILVGFVYTRSNLLYVNFMLILASYNLFNVKDSKNDEYIIISKQEKIPIDEVTKYNVIDDNFLIDINGS
jgi:hypothetical protein